MDRPTPVELIVLCGFLGSGKTSLLVDFLRAEDAGDTAVIVNEAGEIGVDGAIVADGGSGVPMTLLANGCVCCSLRSGLVDTVHALLNAPRPDGRPLARIILETSGLSRPGPIIASLADPELVGRGLRLCVVTTYDCARGPLGDEQFEEAAAQFAAAQRIVLTKTDLASPGEASPGETSPGETSPGVASPGEDGVLGLHAARARALNPLAEIVAETDRALAVARAFAPLAAAAATDMALAALNAAGAAAIAGRDALIDHPRIRVWRGTVRQPVAWSAFSTWLDDLAGLCGDRLLRLKALLRVSDCPEPVLVQSVGTTFGMPRRMATVSPDQDVLIVITRDLDGHAMRDLPADAPVSLQALA
ncbi:GTP-binding protein [Bordetella bronchialis]|uniref:Cobalamin biosynthesis protein CobW n=2 Tax=Bordetella bronchialis TaxID=463025 RepID=A0ABN4R0Y4_9BORD|nr:GTP-binding protein [Bordetella bronchialis]ANN65131.1 cobalamin biosynthesis protein CobW [Bordetella bronchialis]